MLLESSELMDEIDIDQRVWRIRIARQSCLANRLASCFASIQPTDSSVTHLSSKRSLSSAHDVLKLVGQHNKYDSIFIV